MFIPAKISRRAVIRAVTQLGAFWLGLAKLVAADTGEGAAPFSATTMDGEKYTNASLKGKVVLIEFWATWCPVCKKDEPALETVTKEFAKDGLVVLAVDMGEPRRKVKKYLEVSPRSCKVVLAEDTNLAAIYEATVYPMYVLMDRDGAIAGEQRGAGGEQGLRELVARAGLKS